VAVPLRLIRIDENELDQIKTGLGAIVDIYLGKAGAGSEVDTLRIKRGDAIPDLEDAAKYATYTEGYEPASKDLVFKYPPEDVPLPEGTRRSDVKIRISTINGSVWFKSAATEEVIDYVWSVVRKVKKLA
jgi:hypothetical protein